jgi:uncharacterized membrane protein
VGEHVFALLFKYRPVVFEHGGFAFSPPWPAAVSVLLVLAAVLAAWFASRSQPGRVDLRRQVLVLLRASALALLLFTLLRPVVTVKAVEARQNFLAVLLDDSLSMSIADRDGVPRGAFLQREFGRDGSLRRALGDRFALRFFRFSSSTERAAGAEALSFSGTRSNLAGALDRVHAELAGVPLSGIVVVSDGADTSSSDVVRSLSAIQAARVPVFTVGVGRERFDRDVQLGRVEPPVSALQGSTLVVEVPVVQSGYAGRSVSLIVDDEGKRVGSTDVTLPHDGEPVTARVRLTLGDAGPRVLRFSIPAVEGEQVSRNNAREAVVNVRDRREKLLYIEGEPRFEMKFLRQALSGDGHLQVVTLQRTADRKFLRLDVDGPEDLLGGFPKTRDELFAYRGLVLGSIEASAFTPDQLRMMADFVSIRGGGLLALGGRHAFAEGGYSGTPIADALPVLLDAPRRDPGAETVNVRPTRVGETHVVTQVAATEEASAERWKKLPALTAVNAIRRVKPGAALLLKGGTGESGQVVLASQRYGAGKALALPVQDSWMWQMDASIPVDDQTHETFWRRLVRWLVDGVPDRVEVALDHERVEPGEPIRMRAAVRDRGFVPVNDAVVRARVVGPSGREVELPLELDTSHDGEYTATFTPDTAGLYAIRLAATRGSEVQGESVAYVRAAAGDAEYFDAGQRAPLLQRIAKETGGRYYTPATASRLAEDATYLGRGLTTTREMDLWDMPIVLVMLLGLLGTEWFLRRRWGWA